MQLVAGQFKDCTSLVGSLHFRNVTWVGSRKGTLIFTNRPPHSRILPIIPTLDLHCRCRCVRG